MTVADMERCLTEHDGWCWKVANRVFRSSPWLVQDQPTLEELYHAARAGLCEGLARWESPRGVQPLSYAGWSALSAAQRHAESLRPGGLWMVSRDARQVPADAFGDPAEGDGHPADWLSHAALRGARGTRAAALLNGPDGPPEFPPDFWPRVMAELPPGRRLLVAELCGRRALSADEAAKVLGCQAGVVQQHWLSVLSILRRVPWLERVYREAV